MGKWVGFLFLFLSISIQVQSFSSSSSPLQSDEGSKDSAAARTLKQDQGIVPEIHCSRERSRAAWKIIEEYLTPFVEKERYKILRKCRLHPENDLFRDQEEHKIRYDINEWRCGYCKKSFYEEKYLDQHFNNRHYNLLNVTHGKCLADVCGAVHCDLMMDTIPRKTKCNPAAAARNKHTCESLADTCFPVHEGPSASRLHEFFLRQFCDAHTCSGNSKPFPRGHKERTSGFYIAVCILIMLLLPLFYMFIYLYQRGMNRRTQDLKRISLIGRKKKSF